MYKIFQRSSVSISSYTTDKANNTSKIDENSFAYFLFHRLHEKTQKIEEKKFLRTATDEGKFL